MLRGTTAAAVIVDGLARGARSEGAAPEKHAAGCVSTASSSADGGAGGRLDGDLPQPWDESLLPRYAGWDDELSRRLDLNDSADLLQTFRDNHAALRRRQQALGLGPSEALVRAIRSRGVRIGAYGIDYAAAYERAAQNSTSAYDPLQDRDVRNSLWMLVGGAKSRTHGRLSRTDELIWRCDAGRRPACPASGSKAADASMRGLARRLHTHGFVRVRDWGLDIDALEAQARHALEHSRSVKDAQPGGIEVPLPALQPLLSNASLSSAIRGYLGDNVRYDGHVVKDTPARWSRSLMQSIPAGVSAVGLEPTFLAD